MPDPEAFDKDGCPTATGTPPEALPALVEHIPAALKALPQWVVWRYTPREGGKWTKVPKNPRNGRNASSTNPKTWGLFDAANDFYRELGYDGLGFMPWHNGEERRVVCGDLDRCRNEDTGAV